MNRAKNLREAVARQTIASKNSIHNPQVGTNQFKRLTNPKVGTKEWIKRTVISTKPLRRIVNGPVNATSKPGCQNMDGESDSDAPLCKNRCQQPSHLTEEDEIQIFVHTAGKQIPVTISTHSTFRSVKEKVRNNDRWTYAGKIMHDDQKIHQCKITDGATIVASPDLNGGGNDVRTQIKEKLRAVLKADGDKFNMAIEGIHKLIQKCEKDWELQNLKMLADDTNCKPKVLFRFSKSIDPNIAYISLFIDNQTMKPKGKNAWNTETNHNT